MKNKFKFLLPIIILLLTFLIELLISNNTPAEIQYIVGFGGLAIAAVIIFKNAKVIKL